MNRFDKRWILFLVLIIVLASGLSYLTLKQETASNAETETANETQVMSIALVNEDQGSSFNGTDLAFGEAFVKSVSGEESNEWYVVSRGVAESGLKNNTYDMMIVIPHDFSEKSLNIDADAPEQVVLDYKINASENPRMKEQAEKTASNILNDFNRRIIDVYFASIITNLQNAQDNVGEMVNRQAQYTSTYNRDVQQPLSGYTDRFQAVKDNTELSKDSFTSFGDLLNSYEDQLGERMEQSSDYLTNIEEVVNLKEENSSMLASFNEEMNQFNQGITAAEVDQQLEQLMSANNAINQQFTGSQSAPPASVVRVNTAGVNTANIYSGSISLESQLQASSEKVAALQQDIEAYLTESNETFREKIRTRIEKTIADQLNADSDLNINILFENPDQIARDRINAAIGELPSLNPDDFTDVGLPNSTVSELTTVINVTNKYRSEFDNVSIDDDAAPILKDEIDRLTSNLKEDGLQVTDTVQIPENKKEGQIFRLQVPNNFDVTYLGITLPGGEEQPYTDKLNNNGEVNLPANGQGEFTVTVNLQLNGSTFDLYQPVNWSWSLEQKNMNNIDEPDELAYLPSKSNLVATATADNSLEEEKGDFETAVEMQDTPRDETADEEVPEEDTDEPANPDDNNTEQPSEGSQDEEQGENETANPPEQDEGGADEDPADPEEPGNTDDGDEEDKEQEPEKLYMKDNMIRHEIMSPADELDDTTESLIKAVTNTLSSYQKLAGQYESYFGFNMDDLPENLGSTSLKNAAAEDSLYYLFNKKDISQLLTDYMTNQIVNSVSEQLRTPAETFQTQVNNYQNAIQQTIEDADNLTAEINETSEQAQSLNDSLNQTIEDVQAWRENVLALLNEQEEIQANADGEQNAVMTLGTAFEPLLSTSEQLADQAQNNLDTADQVYDTFDSIDQQATDIEESGSSLVSNAETLAANLTDKLSDDQTFQENFSQVLANSRIGDRQNENLFEFLSNPVETSNEGTIAAQAETAFTPYYLVLISFIVVLFTAYVISTLNQKRMHDDQFSEEASLMKDNTPITIITAGIGLLEGIVIGIVSSYYLPITNLNQLQLTAVMALLVMVMLLAASYLLRQLKMVGMFVLLAVLSVYLFFTDALGASTSFPAVERFSPLQYMETFMLNIVEGSVNYGAVFLILILAAAVTALANLFVISRNERGDETANDQTETG